MTNNNQVKQLHRCLIYIADEIDRICRINNIQYFLIAGTLLGAVRHKGIIPWDDDIDIGMLREDYNRFVEACKRDLGPRFSISEFNTEPSFGMPFTKIKLKGTRLVEEGCPKDLDESLFVDVIPIDKMPEKRSSQMLQMFFTNTYKFLLLFNCGYDMSSTRQHGAAVSIASVLSKLPKRLLASRLVRWQTRYNNTDSKTYINLCSSYPYGKEIFPYEALSDKPLKTMTFEGREYFVPHCVETILSQLYGNYLDLPPVESRVFRHTSETIDFGIYSSL